MTGKRISLAGTALLLAITASGCITSRQQEEMQKQMAEMRTDLNLEIARLREELLKKELALGNIKSTSEDASRRVQGAKGEVEDLKRQLALTQGSLDELQTKFSRFVDASTKGGASGDAMFKLSELEAQVEMLDRKASRMELVARHKSDGSKPPRVTAKYSSIEELEKALVNDLAKKEYRKVQSIATQVLASDSSELAETALRFRAESHFAAQDFFNAAVDLSEFVERFPRNPKYPRMLLLAGDSFVYLKNFRMARSYYSECTRVAPDRDECKAAKDRLSKLPGT